MSKTLVERLQVQARDGLMGVPDDFKIVGYGEAAARIIELEKAFDELMDLYNKKTDQFVAECKRSAALQRQLKDTQNGQ